ncbi:M48 family metallopeptidase [Nitrincola sp. MINF-07-Sa-05]|uniref:M48 family metallopeptidase n=1 Tax=Nitrincola salilacus TaxID=3400273 RepID=UPI003917CD55
MKWRESELGFPCRVVRSARRTTSIEIVAGEVVVRAPNRVSEPVLLHWVQQKRSWVMKHLTRQQHEFDHHEIRLKQGAEIPLNGTPYRLQWFVGDSSQVTRLDNATLLVSLSSRIRRSEPEAVEELLKSWLLQEAQAHLTRRLHQLSQQTALTPSALEVKGFKRRWGQCSTSGLIKLNWRLIHAPQAVQDYVIIHELCHLREMNHSPAFWQLVARHCPDYKALRSYIKKRNAWLEW